MDINNQTSTCCGCFFTSTKKPKKKVKRVKKEDEEYSDSGASTVTGMARLTEDQMIYREPWQRIFEEYLPRFAGNVPWVNTFLRKSRHIILSTYERTKRY